MPFPAAVPEIPAANVDKAAAYYVNTLGLHLRLGRRTEAALLASSRGNCRQFITNRSFRESYGNIGPTLFWLNLDSKDEVDELRTVEGRAREDRFRARGQTVEAARVYGRRS